MSGKKTIRYFAVDLLSLPVFVPVLNSKGEQVMERGKKGDRERPKMNRYDFVRVPKPTGSEGRADPMHSVCIFTIAEDGGKVLVNDAPLKEGNTKEQVIEAVEDLRAHTSELLTEEQYEKQRNPEAYQNKVEKKVLEDKNENLEAENRRLRDELEKLKKKA